MSTAKEDSMERTFRIKISEYANTVNSTNRGTIRRVREPKVHEMQDKYYFVRDTHTGKLNINLWVRKKDCKRLATDNKIGGKLNNEKDNI